MDPEASSALGHGEPGEEARDWHAARLASAVFVMGRLGHDLRGILSPALLAAERLQEHPDAAVRRGAETMLRAVDRATLVLGEAMRGLRERVEWNGPSMVALRDVLGAAPAPHDAMLANQVVPEAMVFADGEALARAIGHLLLGLHAMGVQAVHASAGAVGSGWALRLDFAPPPEWPASYAQRLALPRSALATAAEWLRGFGAEPPEAVPDGLQLILRGR